MTMENTERLDGKRILIVDDEPDVVDTLKGLLTMCDVVGALEFETAEALLEKESFDLAILDIMGVEGYDLLKIAKQNGVPAVMLTAHALSPQNVLRSYKEGAASYVPKDEMANIATYLNDILEAKEKGKSTWWRWFDRFADYFDKKFGPEWQKRHGVTVR
jgi:DNA-binding NtrC family response regulator